MGTRKGLPSPPAAQVSMLLKAPALSPVMPLNASHSPLTSNERILVLSDVLRGLAYLHAEVRVINRDVKSVDVLIDQGCVGPALRHR